MNTRTTILRRFFQNGFLSGLLRKWVGIMLMLFLAGFLNGINAQTDLPDIDVQGNGISIVSGDNTPSATDGTDFGWSDVGVTGNSRQFKIYNTGTATLTLKNTPAVQIVGLNPTDFYSANIYSTTLAPGEYLDLDLTFTPGGAGLRTAKISIQTNDHDESLYTFAIQGTGIGKPDIDIRGHNVSIANFDQTPSLTDGTDFGSVNVGVTQGQIWEIYNTGTTTLHLTGVPIVQINGTNAADFYFVHIYSTTLEPGEHTEVDMAFTPSGPGLRTAYITILSNDVDETPFYFGIQGTGIGIPDIDVRGNNISIAWADQTPSLADGTDFGSANVGETQGQIWEIYNTGTATLRLTGVPIVQIYGTNAADFHFVHINNTTLEPGEHTEVDMAFTPSGPGLRTAYITILSNDIDELIFYFAIQGTGIGIPDIDVRGNGISIQNYDTNPSTADGTNFGIVYLGSVKSQVFMIYNTGHETLNLTGTPAVQFRGGAIENWNLVRIDATTLLPGQSTELEIAFAPIACGLRPNIVSIPNNDPDENPFEFVLLGSGGIESLPDIDVRGKGVSIANGDETPSVSDATDFGSTTVGETSGEIWTIHNTGNFTLNLTGTPKIQISGPHAADFDFIQIYSSTLAPNANTEVHMAFIPSAPGLRTATITIQSDDPDENPFVFAIQGTGLAPADNVPPEIVTNPVPMSLWPPNHKYKTITLAQCVASVSDNCTPLAIDDIVISQVTSDELEDVQGGGDGNTIADIVIASDCQSVQLRSERNGNGNGRVYTIHFSVADEAGNIGTATYWVTVPHSQNGDPAVDDGPVYVVNSNCGGLPKMAENQNLAIETNLPEGYVLDQNYPNPFNPQTLISYSLPFDATVSLKVYDGLGREVVELLNISQPAGVYQAIFNGQGLASGVYYYAIKAIDTSGKTFSQTKRMLLTK